MKQWFSNKRIISIIISVIIVLISSLVFAMDFLDTEISEETRRIKNILESNSFYVVNYVGLSEHSIHMESATVDWFEGEKAYQRFLSYDSNEMSDEYLYYYTLYMWMSGHVEQVWEVCNYVETKGLSKPWDDHFKFFMAAVNYVSQEYGMATAYLNTMDSYDMYGEVYNQLSQLILRASNDKNTTFKESKNTVTEEYEAMSRFYSNLDKYNYKILAQNKSGENSLQFELLGKAFKGVLVVSKSGNATYSDNLGIANLDSEASIFYIPWQKIHNTCLDTRNWSKKNKFHFIEGLDLGLVLKDGEKIEYTVSPRHHALIKNEKGSIHAQNGVSESKVPINHESGTFKMSDLVYSSPFETHNAVENLVIRFNVEVDGFQNGFFSTALSQSISFEKKK